MKHDELLHTLSELAAERLALLLRHEAGARSVGHYDFNNTYQHVVSREETQLGWLRTALAELGATLPPAASTLPIPVGPAPSKGAAPDRAILEDDARHLHQFVERWRDRVEAMTQDRHRIMLNVILGESIEHQRLFEQAASGFEDVLGRRTGGVARVGEVLSTRWVE
ncbi:MAG: hypothetical protein ACRD26_03745 [Vicinamibacterales bacterium]